MAASKWDHYFVLHSGRAVVANIALTLQGTNTLAYFRTIENKFCKVDIEMLFSGNTN